MEYNKEVVLQSTLYKMLGDRSTTFYGFVLQCLDIKFCNLISTAGISYDKRNAKFVVRINPEFFCTKPVGERCAIIQHEVMHFTHSHLIKMDFSKLESEDKTLYNIAMDMAINQYIKNLPQGCVKVQDWKLEDDSAFPLNRSFEEYYNLIKKTTTRNRARGQGEKINDNVYDKLKPFDEHDWESLTEEEKQEMLDKSKSVVERSIEKTVFNHGNDSNIPKSAKEILEQLNDKLKKFDAKNILKKAIRKNIYSYDRETTWVRRNKRYGVFAPGSKTQNIPMLNIYFDTSGSISLNEMTQFTNVIDSFIKAGCASINLVFWNDDIYLIAKHKKNKPLPEISSGGTNLEPVLKSIKKENPNLSIILTDGYYEQVNIKLNSEVIFVISKDGNSSHPMKHLGTTIELKDII
jgi:predicted metal-dependent peptidase